MRSADKASKLASDLIKKNFGKKPIPKIKIVRRNILINSVPFKS